MKQEFFETIKIEDAKICHIKYHQKRYESVLLAHGKKDFLDLRTFITPPTKTLYRCKLIYNCYDNTIQTHYFPYVKNKVTSLKIIHDQQIQYHYKYLERTALDRLFAQRAQADDILIVKDGLITDTSKANIALFKEGRWWTPKKPLLAGTTRQRLLECNKIYEADIDLGSIDSYEKIALMNAMIDFDIQDICEILI